MTVCFPTSARLRSYSTPLISTAREWRPAGRSDVTGYPDERSTPSYYTLYTLCGLRTAHVATLLYSIQYASIIQTKVQFYCRSVKYARLSASQSHSRSRVTRHAVGVAYRTATGSDSPLTVTRTTSKYARSPRSEMSQSSDDNTALEIKKRNDLSA